MKILITGGKGQLGRELVEILQNGESRIGALPEALKNAEITAVDVDELDITDLDAVRRFYADCKPDVIINCAAMTNVDGCETQFETAMLVNGLGPQNLAIAAAETEAKLIHVSTDYVFRGDEATPRCEWDNTAPYTIYGKSKLLGEQAVLRHCPKSFVVRTAWLYGQYGNNFVKTMQRLGAEKEELTVVADQRGNPTNANDLAHHLCKLALTEAYGIYHCTGNGECSWYEFACRIMEESGLSCRVRPVTSDEYPSKTPRPKFSSLRNLMLSVTVGDEMRQWEDALHDFVQLQEEK